MVGQSALNFRIQASTTRSLTTPSLNKGERRELSLEVIVRNRRVVHHDTLQVVVRRVISIQEATGNIRHELSSIGLSGNVDLIALDRKGVDKVLEPGPELRRYVLLRCGSDIALREARSNRLFNPEDVGKLVPRVRILYGLESSVLPEEWTVFLEQALERRTAGLRAQ